MADSGGAPAEAVAAVPVGELRKLADLLGQLDIDLADDLVAGLANRMLRHLARRWADTVSVWVIEAEVWGGAGETPAAGAAAGGAGGVVAGARLAALDDAELLALVRAAVDQLAARQGRRPGDVLAELARHAP